MTQAIRKSRDPGSRDRLPPAAADQGHPEGDAAGRRPAGDRAHRPRTGRLRHHRHHHRRVRRQGPDPAALPAEPGPGRPAARGRQDAYAQAVQDVAELSRAGHITYLDQHGPYGNGTPVLNAARGTRRRADAGAVAGRRLRRRGPPRPAADRRLRADRLPGARPDADGPRRTPGATACPRSRRTWATACCGSAGLLEKPEPAHRAVRVRGHRRLRRHPGDRRGAPAPSRSAGTSTAPARST